MVHLRQILVGIAGAGSPGPERLDRAALDLASIHEPELDPEPSLLRLNELASSLGDRLRNFNDGRDFVEKAESYLFGEVGFKGNLTEYFDPRNSCLNHVIERQTGLPIALCVLYMEISRRLQMPVFGIDLPRHFIVKFDDGRYATYIDPFNGGKALSAGQCFALAQAQTPDPALLEKTTNKRIVMRMLRNLLNGYLRVTDFPRSVQCLDLLLEGNPEVAEWYRQRGALNLRLKHAQAGRKDLEKYLALSPMATDREEILRQLEEIHRWLGRNN